MKVTCPSCGTVNQYAFNCVQCNTILPKLFEKTEEAVSSITLLNGGLELYETKNYSDGEVIFRKLLEKNTKDYLAALFLAFTKHQQNSDFSILLKNIQEILEFTKNTLYHDKIYQETINYINSWLHPEIILNDGNSFYIEWDCLIDKLNYSSIEDIQKTLFDLKAFYAFILHFPSPYPQLFLKSLSKRYQYPWANSWWARDKILIELVLLKDLQTYLKENLQETKIIFSSISDLHIDIIMLYLNTRHLKNYIFKDEQIINWNNTIKDLFNSIDFTENELGFSHEEKMEPYVRELEKNLIHS